MTDPDRRSWLLLGTLALFLCALALVRPVDPDEGRYVAAAVLSASRLLPYRDYAWFGAPLQPLAFAPVAAMAGGWTWPALRIADALLSAAAIGFVFAGARAAGTGRRPALMAAGLMACCDAVLAGAGVAEGDALPLACLSAGLWLAVRQEAGATRLRALGIGLLLAIPAAANLAGLLPLVAYLAAAGVERRRLPAVVLAGVVPVAVLVAAIAWRAPANAWLGIWNPVLWTVAESWRAAVAALALGPTLPALAIVARRAGTRTSLDRLLGILIVAGLLAALLPSAAGRPCWPYALPPLFVALALALERPPSRGWRIALATFAGIGLIPSFAALADAAVAGPAMARAMRDGAAIRAAMDRAHVTETVATLSPHYLPATYRLPDPRFAPGPLYFGSRDPFDPAVEARLHLVSLARLDPALAIRPEAILVSGLIGSEGEATGGEPSPDAALADWATRHDYRAEPVQGTVFQLYVRPR